MADIDESLYSRQLYTISKETMDVIKNTSVLISGMSGLGVEIAKNLILTGVKSVTLHDLGDVRIRELASNYYSNLTDIGKSRVDVVKDKLASLNPYVNVVTNTEFMSENLIKRHQIVVMCDVLPQTQLNFNNIARQYRIKFIVANTIGLMGSIFCDFGNEFTVSDTDGETPSTGIIIQVQNGNYITHENHGLYVGDRVNIKIENSRDNLDEVIKVIDKFTFKTKKCNLRDQLFSGSAFTQLKTPVTMNFKSLKESILDPEFSMVYTEDFDRQRLLHDFLMALSMFVSKNGNFPRPHNKEDANEILNLVKCNSDIQSNVIKKLCYTSSGKTILLDSQIGSMVAQEVIKGASAKYTPIKQWLHIDRTDMLANDEISTEEFIDIPQNRYYGQTLIFGKTLQKKIEDSNVFIVGAGAIGCEHLKNLAMTGVKNITITDMDKIERSNLNRQFLFRYSDIGSFKSEAAKNAIMTLNPDVNIVSQQNKIGSETINIYNKNFFDQFTCVLTALDNVEARKFVDELCLQHGKPMIDSGTLGTKGNTQVVIPHLTQTYGMSQDPPEKGIPVCTLKHFPYLIEHCIQWARDTFEGLFVNAPRNFLEYKNNPEKIREMTPTELTEIVNDINFVKDNMACHSKECIKFAYKLWHDNFRDQIYHLINKFPADSVIVDEKTKEKVPYWTGTKKFPNILTFSSNEQDMMFIEAVANLWAEVCMLNEKITPKQIVQFLKKATPPKITDQTGEIASNEKEMKELEERVKGKSLEELLEMLPKKDETDFITVKSLEFEKDDDTNYHIEFVTQTSNLRASNYGIPTADKFKTKGIAGKIIPAVVTTTSLVSSFVCAELVKVIQQFDKLEQYFNTFSNLALPVIAFSEPIKITKQKIGKYEYSVWDSLVFDDITIRQLTDQIQNNFVKDDTLIISAVSTGVRTLFSIYQGQNIIKDRFDMKISEIYKLFGSDPISDFLEVMVSLDKKDTNDDSNINDEGLGLICKIKMCK